MDLKRILRNYDLGPLLARAKALLEPGWGVAIVGKGEIVASLGLPEHVQEGASPRFTAPFNANGHVAGHVLVAARENASGAFAAQRRE